MARDPRVSAIWEARPPVRAFNLRGMIGLGKFSPLGPTSNIYVNLAHNLGLDTANGGYTPIGAVVENGPRLA